MECLICCQLVFDHRQCEVEDPMSMSMSSTICKLFEIPQSSYAFEYFNSPTSTLMMTTLCSDCSEKMTKVHQLFTQLDEIQLDLCRIKNDVIREMRKSEDLRQSDYNGGQMDDTRSKIVQEICSRNTHWNLDLNISNQLKVEKDNQCQNFILDEDFLDTQENCKDLPSVSVSLSTTTRINFNEAIMNEIKIILEPLPICDNNKSVDINSEPIASFIQRDRKRIRSKSRSKVTSSSTTTTNNSKKAKRRKKYKTGVVKYARSVKAKNNYHQQYKVDPQDRIKYCSICDIHFRRPALYKIHNRIHSGERPFACDRCEKRFRAKYVLVNHLKKHGIGDGVVQCHLCSIFFHSQSKLDDHFNKSHLNLKLFLCEICSKSFKTKLGLNEHRLGQHLGVIFKCPKCETSCKAESALKEHIRRVHEGKNELKYPCPDPNCKKLFLYEYQAKMHNEKVHLKIKKYSCEICGPEKKFTNYGPLKYHIMEHHTNERPWKCDFCNKGFVVKSKLDRHKILHTGIREFSCHICGEAFAVEGTLKLHIQRKHTGQGEKYLIPDVTKRRKVGRRFKY